MVFVKILIIFLKLNSLEIKSVITVSKIGADTTAVDERIDNEEENSQPINNDDIIAKAKIDKSGLQNEKYKIGKIKKGIPGIR